MVRRRTRSSLFTLGHELRTQQSKYRDARDRLRYECLEPRHLLAGDLLPENASTPQSFEQSNAPITWFEHFDNVDRIQFETLHRVDRPLDIGVAGPQQLAAGEWIVQLTGDSSSDLRTVLDAEALLDNDPIDFSVISGLGSPGLILVRGEGFTRTDIENSLSGNTAVEYYNINQLIKGQETIPNDPEFSGGLLPGLVQIEAKNAWDQSRGNVGTVVGVVDSGIDATHPDLFLNIWLNQGEIPGPLKERLTDTDGDGLITFYDLNNLQVTGDEIVVASTGITATLAELTTQTPNASGVNSEFVQDLNGNGRIDAIDLLDDVTWADGRDSDGNGFFDDIFGVNFRSGNDDPFASNRPLDQLGHGTHVSGTIGAVGNNSFGVVGVNWQTSLMSLRILDNNNQADASAAIRAINYAKSMRERMAVDDNGRVVAGADVRVLNNSWGQPGGFDQALDASIRESGDEGILFVAAAGNGNILGNGVDNDATPFYPASYDSANVIGVAALSSDNETLASFSNFGKTSIDIAAPGVGIRSTLPGGGFGPANGTSMASPHVAGTAALIWSAFPQATVKEIRDAILNSVTPIPSGSTFLSTGGRLNATVAINSDVFAPSATLEFIPTITVAGGTAIEFTVRYNHQSGIRIGSLGNDDLIVTRLWGPTDVLKPKLVAGSIVDHGSEVSATYVVTAPGGNWDPLDFGEYKISTVANKVRAKSGNKRTETRDIGSFRVRIEDPTVLYVDSLSDVVGASSLRDAIIAANAAAPEMRTIILDSGTHTIDLPPVPDATSTFPNPHPRLFCGAQEHTTGWSNETTGDFDITGAITIVGDRNDETIIDAQGLDRVFKVHPDATLNLSRVTVTGGVSPMDQGGGGILSAGSLSIHQTIVRNNISVGTSIFDPIRGGGIAAWGGTAELSQSWITQNESNYGGGVFYCGNAGGEISRSTIDNNLGGGLHSHSTADLDVSNSTFSANSGGRGAIYNGQSDGFSGAYQQSNSPAISANGRFIAFTSNASDLVPQDDFGTPDYFLYDRLTQHVERIARGDAVNTDSVFGFDISNASALSETGRYLAFYSSEPHLVPEDTNQLIDAFVYDRILDTMERVSVSSNGIESNADSGIVAGIAISASGRFVTFESDADNLVPNDNNSSRDVFIYDRTSKTIERASVASNSLEANSDSSFPSISSDGRFVAFESDADNLVPDDDNQNTDVFIFDRLSKTTQRVSVNSDGSEGNGLSRYGRVSGDGRFVAFDSEASNLVPSDENNRQDVFVYDLEAQVVERVSVSADGAEANDESGNTVVTLSLSPGVSISDDGRFIAFQSLANNLVPGDDNDHQDIFVVDRIDGTIQRLTGRTGSLDLRTSLDSASPSISSDGRFVTFVSSEIDGLANDISNIYLYDRTTDRIKSATILANTNSVINASQITVVATRNAEAAVGGAVNLTDSLLTLNSTTLQFGQENDEPLIRSNLVTSLHPNSDLVEPLTRLGDDPPIHRLLLGNPAIDSGASNFIGTTDQRGNVRDTPDVGAVETLTGALAGSVFVDFNNNQMRDPDEPGIATVRIEAVDQSDGSTIGSLASARDDLATFNIDEAGRIQLLELSPVDIAFSVDVPSEWSFSAPKIRRVKPQSFELDGDTTDASVSADGRRIVFVSDAENLVAGISTFQENVFLYSSDSGTIDLISVNRNGGEPNGQSLDPTISSDGRFITFESDASDLVPNDTNGRRDIFVYDSQTRVIERVSVSTDGSQANGGSFDPDLSSDGRYVTFYSLATNLIPNDVNNRRDAFVFDRRSRVLERISSDSNGVGGDDNSFRPSISGDGRFVAFASFAANLVAGDTNEQEDIFVFDRQENTFEIISNAADGSQANGQNRVPVISPDGRYIAFESEADNLVPDDDNESFDIFVVDRLMNSIERVNVNSDGAEASGSRFLSLSESRNPSISGDGRFVVYDSEADNLVPNDNNLTTDVFVHDRHTGDVARVSVNRDGTEAESADAFFGSESPVISRDGRLIVFHSFSENLVDDDTNEGIDVFTVPNPLAEPGASRSVRAGELVDDLDFGLIPNPGVITGVLYHDIVRNLAFDSGEPTINGWTVFLDSNRNEILDSDELFILSDSNGVYRFDDVQAFRQYAVYAVAPEGWEQVAPGESEGFAWSVFLPPGGSVPGRDFGFRRVTGSGQSINSSVSGRVFNDVNDNGQFDADVDTPASNTVIYLDRQNFGVRDEDEPAVATDDGGNYSIGNLGASVVAVSTQLDERTIHASPLGSSFERSQTPLFDEIAPFGNPQSIVTGDFNADGFPDVAVALSEANTISIRLNDGRGGFQAEKIDIDLGTSGGGPTSLVVGQFNGADTPLDIAVTNNFASNVTILLDFNGGQFDSMTTVKTGQEPLDIVSAQITGDVDHLDLVVVNQADATIQSLLNDGQGGFIAQTPIDTGGNAPVALVAGNFVGDSEIDVAVVHAAPASANTPFGDVRVYQGDGSGQFGRRGPVYEVGATPTDIVVANFDNDPDGLLDFAVSNFGSNSLSILTGNNNSTFTVQPTTLGTSSGAFDIVAGDVDNDGDVDVVASNLLDRNISIFRNATKAPGEPRFEPLEAVGLGQFGIAQRMPLALANFDQDRLAPGRAGTLDIVAIPRLTDTLYLLKNTLVNGTHRVELTGLNQVTGLDILLKPAILSPSLDAIGNSNVIVEDALRQTIQMTGISKGRQDGPPLMFVATSSNPTLVSNVTIEHVDDSATATLNFRPNSNQSGEATISVTVIDAGADQQFETDDDAAVTRSFTTTVIAVNDPPTFEIKSRIRVIANTGPTTRVAFASEFHPGGGEDEGLQTLLGYVITTDAPELFLSLPTIQLDGRLRFTPAENMIGNATVFVRARDSGGTNNDGVALSAEKSFVIQIVPESEPQTSIVLASAGETVVMKSLDETLLATVKVIDITGTGDNVIVLDAETLRRFTPNKTLLVIANQGDTVEFGAGWQFDRVEAIEGRLQRIFTNGAATVSVIGPLDWTNPFIAGDVNGTGDVTAGDALDILFSLNQPQLFNSQGILVDAATVTPSNFRFYDTNEDGTSTAADALFVINVLFLQSLGGSGEGESAPVQSALLSERNDVQDDDNVTLSVEQLNLGMSSKVKMFGRDDGAEPVVVPGDIDSEAGEPSDEFDDVDAILASVLDWIE